MKTQMQGSWWIYTLYSFGIGIYSVSKREIAGLRFRNTFDRNHQKFFQSGYNAL